MIRFKRARLLLLVVALIAGVWSVMAWQSGAWLATESVVVPPGTFTKDGFSSQKKIAKLPHGDVAYLDVGKGPALVLLHGCPFSAFEWRDVLAELSRGHRVIVPDLFGLGDTPVRLDDDYRLPRDAQMVQELLASLGETKADFVAHDHGGATLQLLMQVAPSLIDRAVMTNVEAYDAWPSKPELKYLKAIVNPFTSPIMFQALKLESVSRKVFSIAVYDRATLSPEVVVGWTAPHTASPERWQRLRRFFRWQLDPQHQQVTSAAVPAMRQFERPVLLVWGARDDNFGPALARRLARDIPGVKGIHYLEKSAHMPMQEEPVAYARAVLAFFDENRVDAAAQTALAQARAMAVQP